MTREGGLPAYRYVHSMKVNMEYIYRMLFQYEVFIWTLSMIVIYHVFVSEDKKTDCAVSPKRSSLRGHG